MSLTLYGINLPADRPIIRALQLLPGLGERRAQELCRTLGFAPALLVQDLTAEQEVSLANYLRQNYLVAGPLADARARSIDRLRRNGSVRGYRLRTGLPVRGQRTHSNGRTARRLRGQTRTSKLSVGEYAIGKVAEWSNAPDCNSVEVSSSLVRI
jgi:small subunit ribosomal protein S13